MSIELQLIQNVITHPLYHSIRNPRRYVVTLQMGNAGSARLGHKIYRNFFTRKVELKQLSRKITPGAQLWGMLTRSLTSHAQPWFGFQGSLVKTVAAVYPVSDESSNGAGVEKKEMLKSNINSLDERSKTKEFEVEYPGGPDIDSGNDQGGNGQGGKGRVDDDRGHGDTGGDDLMGLEWWWWWQWKRVEERSPATLRSSYSDPIVLSGKTAQLVAAMMLDSLNAIMLAFLILTFPFYFGPLHLESFFARMLIVSGALLALVMVFLVAIIRWYRSWQQNCDEQDSTDEIGDS